VFSPLLCDDTGITICGRYGTFTTATGGSARDTDWYQIYCPSDMTIDYCGCGDGTLQILVVNGNHGCPVTSADIIAAASTTTPNEQLCITGLYLSAGTYWLWAGAAGFTGVPCGSNYLLTVNGYTCPPVGVEPANWSNVKTLYR
jgi:hypothetical protein